MLKINFYKKIFPYVITSIFLFGFFCFVTPSYAQIASSTNFQTLDPVQTSGGGYGSSASFQLQSSIGQVVIGTSTSASFGGNIGFEYFPFVSSPVVIATAGDTQVSLSWTSAVGFTGWTVSGYRVGVSTVSGSGYVFTPVGLVTSYIVTPLTNTVTYYFVVQALDFFGNVIVTSGQVSATPVAPGTCTDPAATNFGGALPCTYAVTGGGGTFGATSTAPTTGPGQNINTLVTFSGKAYPGSQVIILKDGQIVAITSANANADFNTTLSGLSAGNYTFSVYGEDLNGIRSSPFTFPIYITTNVTTNIGGIFLAPTITTDKSEVKRGDTIVISGQSVPNADVTISVYSLPDISITTKADKNGVYLLNFNTSSLSPRVYSAKSKAMSGSMISPFSNMITFTVGTKNVPIDQESTLCLARADLNCDGRINLVDFSIAAYWYKKPLSDAFKKIESEKLNGDGKIDLVDFSIMAYYWTG